MTNLEKCNEYEVFMGFFKETISTIEMKKLKQSYMFGRFRQDSEKDHLFLSLSQQLNFSQLLYLKKQ